MNSARTLAIRGFLFVCATVVTLTFPVSFPLALLIAVSVIAHDGPLSRASVWLAGWLLLLEIATASPLGTLTIPFCLTALLLSGARRFIFFGFWAERDGWSPADGLRTLTLAFVFSVFGIACWVLTGLLDATPSLPERFSPLRSSIGAAGVVVALSVVLARASTEPFHRTIMYSGT